MLFNVLTNLKRHELRKLSNQRHRDPLNVSLRENWNGKSTREADASATKNFRHISKQHIHANLTLSLRFSKLKWKNVSVIQEGRAMFLFQRKIKRVRSKKDTSFLQCSRPSTLSFYSLKEPQASAIRDFHDLHLSLKHFSETKERICYQPTYSDIVSSVIMYSLWSIACVLSNQRIKFRLIVYE